MGLFLTPTAVSSHHEPSPEALLGSQYGQSSFCRHGTRPAHVPNRREVRFPWRSNPHPRHPEGCQKRNKTYRRRWHRCAVGARRIQSPERRRSEPAFDAEEVEPEAAVNASTWAFPDLVKSLDSFQSSDSRCFDVQADERQLTAKLEETHY